MYFILMLSNNITINNYSLYSPYKIYLVNTIFQSPYFINSILFRIIKYFKVNKLFKKMLFIDFCY